MQRAPLVSASAGLLLAGLSRGLPAQSFEGEIALRTPNGPVEALVKGDRARLNTQTPMGSAAIIFNPAAGEMYVVVDAQKMYMVMKTADAARMADSAMQGHTGAAGTLTALGVTDKVAGYDCEVYRFRSATSAADICLSTGLETLGFFGMFGNPGGMGGMGGMGGGRGRPAPRAPGWAGPLAAKGGFPLRVADTTGTVQFEITRIEKKKVDDALLSPPADYSRMEMPGFGRPPGNR
jgi:hypothetical protein